MRAAVTMRRLILAYNAVPLQGGQGLNLHNMLHGANGSFNITLFCRSSYPEVKTEVVPDAQISGLIRRIPVVRRLRDWQTFFSDSHFDRFVSARMTGADIFQGVTGQCAESFEAARSYGCRTMLDVVTPHVEDFLAQQNRECQRFQVRPAINAQQRARILLEYQRADLIRVMSEHARDTFIERGFAPEHVVVIPPPIYSDEFPEARFDE